MPDVDHRKTPSRKAFVPPGWFLVLTVLVVIGGLGWLGWLLTDSDDRSSSDDPTAAAPRTSVKPSVTTATPSEPSPTAPETTATEAPTTPAATRDLPVSVLNNTGIAGAARAFSAKVQQAGWPVGGVGNWRGSIDGNTIYYPDGQQAAADLLGADVGITRILPRLDPMRADRLTIILSGPQ